MKRVAQRRDPGGCLDPLGLGELERRRETHCARDILGAAAAAALLPAAVHQRLERDAPAHREHAGALGRAELVARRSRWRRRRARPPTACSQPAACTASTCTGMPRSRATAAMAATS